MNNLAGILLKRKALIIILVLVIIVPLILSFTARSIKTPQKINPGRARITPASTSPSVTQVFPSTSQASPKATNTVPAESPTFSPVYEGDGAQPSTQALTPQEKTYTEAKSQIFPNRDASQTGTLVVISDPPALNVVSDISEGGEIRPYTIPYNTTPFKYSNIPAGQYMLSAAALGYDYSEFSVTIAPNQVTRLFIHLTQHE